MPQRFLRPGIRTSEAWNKTSYSAQSLYISILTLVDDFGRYDGRAALIHGECRSLRNDSNPQRTAADLRELHERGLIRLYAVSGKEYLQITQWKEHARGTHSRFPREDTIPQDSAANRSDPQQSATPLVPRSSPLHHSTHTVSAPPALVPTSEDIFSAYPRRIKKTEAIKAIEKAIRKGFGRAFLLERTLAYAKTQPKNYEFTPYPSTWFNAEQFNDDPETWTPVSPTTKARAKPDSHQERLDREYEEARKKYG